MGKSFTLSFFGDISASQSEYVFQPRRFRPNGEEDMLGTSVVRNTDEGGEAGDAMLRSGSRNRGAASVASVARTSQLLWIRGPLLADRWAVDECDV